MKATFNYTGRKRIHRSRILVTLKQGENGVPAFDAQLNLAGLGFPPEAAVAVEAYYKRSFMRFAFGTVACVQPPRDTLLRDIEAGDQVFFRVKVTGHDAEGTGRILGSADRITPGTPEDRLANRKPLLPVNHKDLGQVVWQLAFEEVNGPVLEVNTLVDGIREIVRSDRLFFALVYPSVIQQILTRILLVEGRDADEEEGWTAEWMQWVSGFYRVEPPSPRADEYEVDGWIEGVVAAFCSQQQVRERFLEGLQEGRA